MSKPRLHKNTGYMHIWHESKAVYYHRYVWLKAYGEWPDGEIDHIDHDKLNNSIGNLRVVSHRENNLNRSMDSRNTSGFNGVSWHDARGKWKSSITVLGKNKHLYYGDCLLDAVATRMSANRKYGFHNNHGVAK